MTARGSGCTAAMVCAASASDARSIIRIVGTVLWLLGSISLTTLPRMTHAAHQEEPSENSTAILLNLVLMNAETGSDIVILQNDMVIDTSIVGTQSLTVRADTVANYTLYVQWDLDFGLTRRVETFPPFMLAGKSSIESSTNDNNNNSNNNNYEFYPSNALRKAGPHTITATPVSTGTLDPDVGSNDVAAAAAAALLTSYTVTFYIQHDATSGSTDSLSGDEVVEDENLCNTTAGSDAKTCVSYTRVETDILSIAADMYGRLNYWYASSSVFILAFTGPIAGEIGTTEPGTYRQPSTFADYRCDLVVSVTTSTNAVTNTSTTTVDSSDVVYPCYFSGTGNAANTGDVGGFIWQCPIRIIHVDSQYTWQVSLVHGTNVATTPYSSGIMGNPGDFFNGQTGSFLTPNITSRNNDVLSSSAWLKGLASVDFMDYIDFDGGSPTNDTKTYALYAANATNATTATSKIRTWGGGRGSGIMGTLSKIRNVGNVNVFSLETLSDTVYPFIDTYDRLSYDISKLSQWEVVIAYAAQIDLKIFLFLNADRITDIDERNLYIREMVARFGQYVAAFVVNNLETAVTIRELSGSDATHTRTAVFWRIDTFKNSAVPVSVSENAGIDGIILVLYNPTKNDMYDITVTWKLTNPQLLVTSIAVIPNNSLSSSSQSTILWSNLFAGGSGVLIQHEGSNNQYDTVWMDLGGASLFSAPSITAAITIWQRIAMTPPLLTPNPDVVTQTTTTSTWWSVSDAVVNTILIYVTANESNIVQLQLGNAVFDVDWVDPWTGAHSDDAATTVTGNNTVLGSPPSASTDWIAWLVCSSNCNV